MESACRNARGKSVESRGSGSCRQVAGQRGQPHDQGARRKARTEHLGATVKQDARTASRQGVKAVAQLASECG